MSTQPDVTPEDQPVDEHTFRNIAAVAGHDTARVLKKIHDHLFPAGDDNTEEHELKL